MDVMVARVIHVFGVERLGLGVLRSGNVDDLKPHNFFKSRMFPKYILSFAASIVSFSILTFDFGYISTLRCFLQLIAELIKLSFSADMHGLEVFETRQGPSLMEKFLLDKCNSSLDAMFSGRGRARQALEAILCNISLNLDSDDLLRRNKIHCDKMVELDKFKLEHSLDYNALEQRLKAHLASQSSEGFDTDEEDITYN